MLVLVFLVTVVCAPLAAAFDRRAARLFPRLFLMSVLGVYVCVPDTELPAALVGAAALPALLGFDRLLRAAPWATAALSAPAFAVAWFVLGIAIRGRRPRPTPGVDQ